MKNKTKNSKKLLAIVLTAIMVLSVCAVGIVPIGANAEGVTVTRELPSIVKTNEMFVVTLMNQSGFFLLGRVTETLPEGFEYVNGSFTGKGTATYNEPTQELKLEFRNETSVTYSVNASSYDQIPPDPAEFSGTYKGFVIIDGGIKLVLDEEVGGKSGVIVDGTPPNTYNHNPEKSATNVPIDTNITVHVKDNFMVNSSTIVMSVEGEPVTPEIILVDLLMKEFKVIYDPPGNFSSGEVVNVTINASDGAENAMTTDEYSFTTVGGEEKPDLIVTEITPNCGYLFANESNNINATIKNNGTGAADAFNVSFDIDSVIKEVRISELAAGASEEVTVTDPTSRNAGASVTITVTADCIGEVIESNETNNMSSIEKNVANNGYKSKAFAGLPSLVLHEHDTINGSIVYTVGNSSKVELAPTNTTTTGFDISIPGGATVKTARLYVYWYDSWYSTVHGDADLDVTFDGQSFTTPDASYTDTKGFGTYDYPKGTYAYDVTSAVSGTGAYTATIENTAADTNTMLTGQLLLVVYEDATEPEMEYWITEGCDLLKADSNYCVSPEEAIANVTFAGTIDVTDKSASLITVVAQGNEAGTDLSFNAQVWEDVWQTPEGSSKIDIDDRDVTDYLLGNDNVVDFRDTGTQGMQASNAILVVEYAAEVQPDLVITDKWINWPINCTICYNITNTGSGTAQAGHNTTLYVDETEVAHGQVPQELTHGESYIGCFEGYGWVYTPLEDNITVCADYNETIDESNETNNCLTNIWKCGEVTGDGWILTDDGDLVYYVAGGLIDTGALTTEWAADVTGDGWILTDDGDLVYYVAGGLISESNLNCRCMG